MKTKLRIVSATVHQESKEVEIIIEKTVALELSTIETLHSIWIDCEEELNDN